MGAHYKYIRTLKDRAAAAFKCVSTNKRRFESAAAATQMARKWIGDALRGRRPPGLGKWNGRYLRAYACNACGGWHLTHAEIKAGLRVNPLHEVRG